MPRIPSLALSEISLRAAATTCSCHVHFVPGKAPRRSKYAAGVGRIALPSHRSCEARLARVPSHAGKELEKRLLRSHSD